MESVSPVLAKKLAALEKARQKKEEKKREREESKRLLLEKLASEMRSQEIAYSPNPKFCFVVKSDTGKLIDFWKQSSKLPFYLDHDTFPRDLFIAQDLPSYELYKEKIEKVRSMEMEDEKKIISKKKRYLKNALHTDKENPIYWELFLIDQ